MIRPDIATSDIVERYQSGDSMSTIATELRCSLQMVANRLKKAGVHRRGRGNSYRLRRTLISTKEAVRLYHGEGWSLVDVAKFFGCAPDTVRRRLTEAGRPPRYRCFSLLSRIRMSAAAVGCSPDAWVSFSKRRRNSQSYKKWRKTVAVRDQTCRLCGATSPLQAHHILTVASFPGLVCDPLNGVALCKECHDGVSRKEQVYAAYFEYRLRRYF